MSSILIPGSGAGGVSSSELTATAGDVLKGAKYVGQDTNDDIGTGTLELTGNATTGDVLANKTFYINNPKSKQTGTLTLSGNAAASRVLSPYTFYTTDPKTKLTGTIPSYSGRTITPGTSNQTISAGNYLSGNVVIAGDGDLVAANIKNGKNIFGVNGSCREYKYIQVNLTASTTKRTFYGLNAGDPNTSFYYIDYAPGFTPQMYILHCSNGDGMPMEVTKTVWGLFAAYRTNLEQTGQVRYYKTVSETASSLILPAGSISGDTVTLRVYGYV